MAETHTEAPPRLKDLSNALSSVTKWHTLGVKLGLESHDLATIQQDNPRDSNRCRDEMIACCLRSANPPTWETVADALCEMGEHQVADKIRTRHPSSFTATRLRGVCSRKYPAVKRTSAYTIRRKRLTSAKGARLLHSHKDPTSRMRKHRSSYKKRRKRLKSMKDAEAAAISPTTSPQSNSAAALIIKSSVEKMEYEFAYLVATTSMHLQENGVRVNGLLTFLIAKFSSPDSMDGKQVVIEVVESATTMDDIFRALSKHRIWDYYNYQLLQIIVKKFCCDDHELKRMMEQYQEAFRSHILVQKMEPFLDAITTSAGESLANQMVPPPDLFKDLTAKVGVNITEHSLHYVEEIRNFLCHQISLPEPAMILHRFAKGCISITWRIPANLVEYVTGMTQESSNVFANRTDLHILRMTLDGRCIYPVKAVPPLPEFGTPKTKRDPDGGNISGLQACEVGHEEENIKEQTDPGRKGDPDEGNLPLWLRTPEDLLGVVHKQEHPPVHKKVNEEANTGRKRDPDVGNLEKPQATGDIHEEEPLPEENVSKVKDPNGGRPADHDDGDLPLPEDSTNVERKDEPETRPEHELRLRSAMVISSNYSLLWQYLDPSQLLPTLLEKFLITEEMKKEAESYSRYAQTSIILRGIFNDYCPANRIYKLCDTLETIPGQEHLGRKLLQDCKHPSPLSVHTPLPSIPATHSDFSEISQEFQQLEHEAIDLLDRFPNALAELKQVVATLVFPGREGKMVPLINPRSYENALSVQELFWLLSHHWNPLSTDLLGLLLEATGCKVAATKLTEFVEARKRKGHLLLCLRQIPSLVDFRSVHRAPLSKLQSLHHSLFAQLPNRQVASKQNTIRISVEVDTNLVRLADHERIITALSGLFWMPKVAFVFAGALENSSVLCWLTFPEFLGCSWDSVTDISGCRLLAETGITRIAVGEWFYQCPTIKEVELLEASCYGLLDTARVVLTNKGTNVNVATVVGVTPLFIASWKGHREIVECLLRANADVNLQNNTGVSPLYVACENNHGEIVDRLLIAKADVNLQKEGKETALMTAARRGSVGIVRMLIQRGANVNLTNKDGQTALMAASLIDHPSVVRVLLQAGATVNSATKDGLTALHFATVSGHEDVLKVLLEANMDPDIKNKGGLTALMVASGKDHPSMVKVLLQAGATVNLATQNGWTALHFAATYGHEDVLKVLLEANMDPDIKDKAIPPSSFDGLQYAKIEGVFYDFSDNIQCGRTALMVASLEGHPSVVRMLLQAGATVNSAAQDGETALHFAAVSGHEDVLKVLLEANMDPDIQDKNGVTALIWASAQGYPSMVRVLLQAGATVNSAAKNGLTALYTAAACGCEDVLKLLNPDVNEEDGETTLMAASGKGHPSVVRILLQAGATVNSATQGQETALMAAAREGSVEIARMLIWHGAHVNPTNKDGFTAFDLAGLEGHAEVCQELLTARPHVADQEEEEDEPQPPQPFERTEYSNCFVS